VESGLEPEAGNAGYEHDFLRDLVKPERHIDGLVGWCQQALDRGDLERALRIADRAVRLSKDSDQLLLLYGAVLVRAGRPSEAIIQFLRAISLGARPEGDTGLIFAQLALNKPEAAAKVVRELLAEFSIKDFPGVAPAVRQVCRALNDQGLGWVSITPDGRLVGEVDRTRCDAKAKLVVRSQGSDDAVIDLPVAGLSRSAADEGYVRFVCDLPAAYRARALLVSVADKLLLGSPAYPPTSLQIDGSVEWIDDRLKGWCSLPCHPRLKLSVELRDQDGRPIGDPIRTTTKPHRAQRVSIGPQSFSIKLAPSAIWGKWLEVWASAPGGGEIGQLPGSPIGWGSIKSRRPISLQKSNKRLLMRGPPPHPVTVIVPVYGNGSETITCLRHLIEARQQGCSETDSYEIAVIDDASREHDLVDVLNSMAAVNDIRLLRNDRNLGFPGTVNRGLQQDPKRDVVVLNSDVLVYGDWLSRMRAAAYGADDIGTVTPFTNEGTILSYPNKAGGNEVPSESTARDVDRAASICNAGLTVDIPTAVGFCMYIRRECLDAVGLFDTASFGRGYGEENDFCMRARDAGWRHVAAPDVFVSHVGGRSFGVTKTALVARNLRVLNHMHPGYDALIQAFIKSDPLARARRNLDVERLRSEPRTPTTLMITLGRAGGVERHVRERAEELREAGRAVLVLRPLGGSEASRCALVDFQDGSLTNLIFELPGEFEELAMLLTQCAVDAVEIHHFLDHDPIVLDLPRRLGVSYEIFLHDFSWICPRITLMDGSGQYCGMPRDTAVCRRCVAIDGKELSEDITVEHLRMRSGRLLARARSVVGAATDTIERIRSFFPDAPYEIAPWEEIDVPVVREVAPPLQGRLRVAVIGAIGQQKGYDVLLACARDAALHDLPLEFVVVGFSQDDLPLFRTGRVFVTGRYEETEAVELIRSQKCHLAFLPSVSPETWSYSLTLAWKAGLRVLAFDYGAIAERIRANGYGWVLPYSANGKEVNRSILALTSRRTAHAPESEDTVISQLADVELDTSPRTVSIRIPIEAGRPEGASGISISLDPGIYSFSLRIAERKRSSGSGGLPAVQILSTSKSSDKHVAFLGGRGLFENWLIDKEDRVVVRASGGRCHLRLLGADTEGGGCRAVYVDCSSLNRTPTEIVDRQIGKGVRLEIVTHVKNRGDMSFLAPGWAGCLDQHFWIEAFAVNPLEGILAQDIEYKALTQIGIETPWTPGGRFCGTRGEASPLVAFAVRLRGVAAQKFHCIYRGAFIASGIIGPMHDGAGCGTSSNRDALEGIQLEIVEKSIEH
jgi:GT2 family glycosyltransferase/glycosyltransferase involved in cell wall biosynthesis